MRGREETMLPGPSANVRDTRTAHLPASLMCVFLLQVHKIRKHHRFFSILLEQICLQQISANGFARDTEIGNPGFALFAESIGIPYCQLEGDAERVPQHGVATQSSSLVQVLLGPLHAPLPDGQRGWLAQGLAAYSDPGSSGNSSAD